MVSTLRLARALSVLGYVQGQSFAHRLDPLTKIVMLLSLCVLAVLARSLNLMLAGLGLALLLLWRSNVGLSRSLARLRFLIWLVGFLFLVQVLFNRSGRPLLGFDLRIGGVGMDFMVTSGGLASGVRMASRLLLILVSSLFFVTTTEPSRLAYSLMSHGVAYRYGFMLVLALRFIPVFQLEASTVRKAQLARGLRIDAPGPRTLVRLARYTFMPLIVSALGRISTISISMEGRGFGSSRKRTFLRQSRFGMSDWVVSLASLGTLVGALLLVR